MSHGAGEADRWGGFRYEVQGKVQGVFFRKYTKDTADKLRVVGWVQNHADGKRVVGEAEGPAEQLRAFRNWLTTEGSPKSVIEKATFTEEKTLPASAARFKEFIIRK